ASKRFSQRWQMTTGLTAGKNSGGLNGGALGSGQIFTGNGSDLNDPKATLFSKGIVGNDSQVAFRLSGSYHAPYDISIAGSLVSNSGYPFVSTYSVTRAAAAAARVGLARASQ